MTDELTLARGIADDGAAPGVRYVTGTVATLAPLTVALNGSAIAVPAGYAVGGVAVGDAVSCLWDGPQLVVLGRLRGAGVTDWQTPTLNSPWANYGSGWTAARYRREGDLVRVEGLIKTTSNITPPNITLWTMPTGYRPPGSILFAAWHSLNGDAPGRVGIDSAGQFQFTYGWGTIVQPVGTTMVVQAAYTVGFLSINCTYAVA